MSSFAFHFISILFDVDVNVDVDADVDVDVNSVPPKCISLLLIGFTTVGTELPSPHILLLRNSVRHQRPAQSTLVCVRIEESERNPRTSYNRAAHMMVMIVTIRLSIVLTNLPKHLAISGDFVTLVVLNPLKIFPTTES